MYFWKVKELAIALKKSQINEKMQKTYLITGMVLLGLSLLAYPVLMATATFNTLDLVDLASFILMTLAGLYITYKINQQGDKKDFWLRYFSLSIPLTIRVVILVFVLSAAGYAVLPFMFPSLLTDETNWFDFFVSFCTELYFTVMIIKYFIFINK